jgi:LPXTG-motif cell wall-anchored protein
VSTDDAEPEPGDKGGVPSWVWILVAVGMVAVGAGGFLLYRRRAKRA